MTISPHKPSPLGFLISDIARQMRLRFDQRIASYGLTQTQWRAILLISSNPGCSQKTLAEKLEIQPISLARLMDRMERGGWIERQQDPSDRRALRLFLTDKAEPILSVAAECSDEVMNLACGGMSSADKKQLLTLLMTVKDNLSH